MCLLISRITLAYNLFVVNTHKHIRELSCREMNTHIQGDHNTHSVSTQRRAGD